MKKIFLFFLLFISSFTKAQTDSCHLTVSLLTCSPGKELYSTFGHSALRVIDRSNNSDIIFNYGTFDFNDPDFYWKFIRGKLLYFVSVDSFSDFVAEYQYEGRGIVEQILNLSCEEKQTLVAALYENAKEENKYYKYDFTDDNCTTRLRDIVAKYCKDPLISKNIRPYSGVTFRKLLHEYLNKGNQYWSKFGIDILLGSPLDKKISNEEAMFLPDYLLKAFDSSSTGSKKLVVEKTTVLNSTIRSNNRTIFTPLVIFSLLFLIIAVLSFVHSKKIISFFRIFDFTLFFLYGLLGLFLLFMWFGTDHPTCRYNFNLLWAFPGHIIIAFFIGQKKKWLKYYFIGTVIVVSLLAIFGEGPQEMNNAFFPLIFLLLLRCFIRYKEITAHPNPPEERA